MSLVAWATGPLSPLGRATGDIFENFQNGHIFLKFLFFLNIKKKKTRRLGPQQNARTALLSLLGAERVQAIVGLLSKKTGACGPALRRPSALFSPFSALLLWFTNHYWG